MCLANHRYQHIFNYPHFYEQPHFYNGLRAWYSVRKTDFPPGFSFAFAAATALAFTMVYCCHADERRKKEWGKIHNVHTALPENIVLKKKINESSEQWRYPAGSWTPLVDEDDILIIESFYTLPNEWTQEYISNGDLSSSQN